MMGGGDHGPRNQVALASCEHGDLRCGPGEGKVGSALGALGADHSLGGGKDLENGWGSGRRGRETQA